MPPPPPSDAAAGWSIRVHRPPTPAPWASARSAPRCGVAFDVRFAEHRRISERRLRLAGGGVPCDSSSASSRTIRYTPATTTGRRFDQQRQVGLRGRRRVDGAEHRHPARSISSLALTFVAHCLDRGGRRTDPPSPASSTACANPAFSDRNPYPGWMASAPAERAAAMIRPLVGKSRPRFLPAAAPRRLRHAHAAYRRRDRRTRRPSTVPCVCRWRRHGRRSRRGWQTNTEVIPMNWSLTSGRRRSCWCP